MSTEKREANRPGRPRGRPRGFETDLALDRAAACFLERGYDGASIDDLTRAMGIARPSLYGTFGDKQGLFLASLERMLSTRGAAQLAALQAKPLAAGLAAYLARVIADVTAAGAAPGCLVACVATDAAPSHPEVAARLAATLDAAEAAIAARIAAAPAAERAGLPPPELTARLVLAVAHGLAVRARAGAAPATLAATAEAFVTRMSGKPTG